MTRCLLLLLLFAPGCIPLYCPELSQNASCRQQRQQRADEQREARAQRMKTAGEDAHAKRLDDARVARETRLSEARRARAARQGKRAAAQRKAERQQQKLRRLAREPAAVRAIVSAHLCELRREHAAVVAEIAAERGTAARYSGVVDQGLLYQLGRDAESLDTNIAEWETILRDRHGLQPEECGPEHEHFSGCLLGYQTDLRAIRQHGGASSFLAGACRDVAAYVAVWAHASIYIRDPDYERPPPKDPCADGTRSMICDMRRGMNRPADRRLQ